jgi:acyl-CoA synthetase (AMP-forming)/AMP-acid ligase II
MVAVLSDNCLDYYVAWWGAQRAGLYFNGMPTSVAAAETAHVVRDCAAGVLLLSGALGETARLLARDAATLMPSVRAIYSLTGDLDGVEPWRDAIARMPSTPIADPSAGHFQPYSSGSTGKPKGLRHPLPQTPFDSLDPMMALWVERYGFREDTVYLAPGPLSHTMTLTFSSLAMRVGATVVQMSRFEPSSFLSQVEHYRVSATLMVPMMFVRLLKSPEAERTKWDVSSLRCVIHSAAPCPADIKRAMIDWWGPIIFEFYSGSEGWGGAIITSQEWLMHPGAVGKPAWGVAHICDDEGEELSPGAVGTIYFESPSQVQVLNDPVKSDQMRHPRHKTWGTFGDVGFLDDDGYLHLVDRSAFAVQVGDRRIYPQPIEDALIAHPRVADAAVFGAPDPQGGERIEAVVLPLDWTDAGPGLAAELSAYCQARLGPEMRPASIGFEPVLPRSESGKLYKRRLQERRRLETAAP